jgi:hypothetical protein
MDPTTASWAAQLLLLLVVVVVVVVWWRARLTPGPAGHLMW